jgi:hypothetical protein
MKYESDSENVCIAISNLCLSIWYLKAHRLEYKKPPLSSYFVCA